VLITCKESNDNESNNCFIPSMITVFIQGEGARVIVASVRKGREGRRGGCLLVNLTSVTRKDYLLITILNKSQQY
jgi:hypothetical protein